MPLTPLKKLVAILGSPLPEGELIIALQSALMLIEDMRGKLESKLGELQDLYHDDVVLKTLQERLNNVLADVESRKGDKGDKGNDYVLTNGDKKEIASFVKVPIVEKVIERTEVIKEQPIVTNEIKEVAVKDTPEEIASKLNTLTEAVDRSVIKGLEDELKKLRVSIGTIPRGGRMGGASNKEWFFEVLTGVLDGENTTFRLSSTTFRTVFLFWNGQLQRRGTDYTLAGSTVTMTFAPTGGSMYAWTQK